mgnify:CR=1 FL=1
MIPENNTDPFAEWLIQGAEYIALMKIGQGKIFAENMSEEQLAQLEEESISLYNKIIEVATKDKTNDEIEPEDMLNIIKSFLIHSAKHLVDGE